MVQTEMIDLIERVYFLTGSGKKYPNIVGGKDLEKNGFWIGVNDFSITAIIHNKKTDKEFIKKRILVKKLY